MATLTDTAVEIVSKKCPDCGCLIAQRGKAGYYALRDVKGIEAEVRICDNCAEVPVEKP